MKNKSIERNFVSLFRFCTASGESLKDTAFTCTHYGVDGCVKQQQQLINLHQILISIIKINRFRLGQALDFEINKVVCFVV